MESVEEAREALEKALAGDENVLGTSLGEGHVLVLLEKEASGMPDDVDGVPVEYLVTGTFHAELE